MIIRKINILLSLPTGEREFKSNQYNMAKNACKSLPTGEREFKCLVLQILKSRDLSRSPQGEREFKSLIDYVTNTAATVAPHRGA